MRSPINRYHVITLTALFLGVLGYVPLWGQDLDFAPAKPDGPAKIQSALWELAVPSAGKLARAEGVEDTVVVILVPYRGQASALIDTSSMAALGVEVKARSKSLMRVSVPASSLLSVSELPGVSFVRRPFRPQAQQIRSEGRRLINSINNYNAGVRGQGVKVAVIDGGFKGANQLRSDMPATWRVLDYTGEGIYAGESVHGTACAEIIYDVAPEAELTLLRVDDLVDLENAKDLCIREGIDIINHSTGWFGTGIGDGRGAACDIVNDAADKGILWVNSAGNDAKSHYDGFWSDSDDDGWQNFSNEDEVIAFEAEKGDEIRIFLTWNDWPTAREDYDLYLDFVNSAGDLEFVAESIDSQSGLRGHIPVERIEITAEQSGEYGISVWSTDARPKRLKIWSLNHDFDEYSEAENSIGSPADARGAMSVGAVYHRNWNAGRIDDYSSRGPTTDGRIKPELVAPTGVSTASYAPEGYFGTSAAAPHVAGAAALIKSANPSYSRTQLWNALVAATVDVGSRGRDNTFGHGKLVLPVMQVPRITSPQITSISPSRVRYNQVVTIRGTAFGANRGTSRVIFHGGKSPSSSQYVSWSNTQIQVRVPSGARTGNVQVVTTNGSDTARLTVTSPWISGVSPGTARSNAVVTVSGENFGSSRGSSSVRIGSTAITSFSSWTSSSIRFRVPRNTPPGNLTVRTAEGTSNSIRLNVTSPYLTSISPTRIKTGNRLTLAGGNFGSRRGTGYVVFGSVRASTSDYVSWSDRRIVVKVPNRAQSGNVQVTTSNGSSGTKRLTVESRGPQISSISPSRVRYSQVITIRGTAFGANRGTSRVVFFGSGIASSSQYVSWSDTQIRVRVPSGTRTGDLQVVTSGGSDTARLTVTSPWISGVSPQNARTNNVVTVNGENFGSSRGSSSVRIGSTAITEFTSWSSRAIRFRVPINTPPGNLTIRTTNGTSNSIRLNITSPYLTSISPIRAQPGDRLTLRGGNFGSTRGSGYVLFTALLPAAEDYVSWSDRRIVVRVPEQAPSGDVRVTTSNGTSEAKRVTIGSKSPQITSISPSRVRYNQVVTIRGTTFGANRGTSRVIFHGGKIPNASQYLLWSDTQIRVRVPAGARTGNVQVITTNGSDTFRLTITSPWISRVSPQTARSNSVVTVSGENFGSSRGSSSVQIGSTEITAFTSWSSRTIRFRIPRNTPPGNLTVRTAEGTSNFIRLNITSPYLTNISPTSVKTGDRLTLTGGNFGSSRGTGYVLFFSSVRPSGADYASWSDRRIVVEVPDEARSGDVQVATSNGTSGTKRLEIESEQLEPLPSRGLFGYSPPAVSKNPKSVKFGFDEGTNRDLYCYFSVKEISAGEVDIFLNEERYTTLPASEDWTDWYLPLEKTDLRSGTDIIEFRNMSNQDRTSSFDRWQLRDVSVTSLRPANAKPVADTRFPSELPEERVSGLGDPFPAPFNAEVTIPFAVATASPVRLAVYNLMGQPIRVLADGWTEAGLHQVRWDGRTAAGAEAASGVYWAVLQAGDAVQTAKLALIR